MGFTAMESVVSVCICASCAAETPSNTKHVQWTAETDAVHGIPTESACVHVYRGQSLDTSVVIRMS